MPPVGISLTCKAAMQVFAEMQALSLQEENAVLRKKLEQYEYTPKEVSCNAACDDATVRNLKREFNVSLMKDFCDAKVRDCDWNDFNNKTVIEAILRNENELRAVIEEQLLEYYDSPLFCEKQAQVLYREIDGLMTLAVFNHYDQTRPLRRAFLLRMTKGIMEEVLERFEMFHPRFVCTDCQCAMYVREDQEAQVMDDSSAAESEGEEDQQSAQGEQSEESEWNQEDSSDSSSDVY